MELDPGNSMAFYVGKPLAVLPFGEEAGRWRLSVDLRDSIAKGD